MMTTRSPVARLARNRRDDVVDVRQTTRVAAGLADVARPARQPTAARRRAASIETPARGSISSGAGLDERLREVRPETRAGTTSPTAARTPPRRDRSGCADRTALQRLENRRRMMGEVVVHRDAARHAAQLEPPAHALELRQRAAQLVRRQARGVADRQRRQRVRTLCAPYSGTSNWPKRLAADASRRTLYVPSARAIAGRAPVRVRREPERLDRRSREAPRAARPPDCRRRESRRPFRGTSVSSRRNAIRSDSMSA